MKKLMLLVLSLFGMEILIAQTAQRDLDINNVRTTITNVGSLFNNGVNARFEVPKGSIGGLNKSTIWAAAPWIAAVSNGQLYLTAETYRQQGKDIQQGPVLSAYTSASLTYWDQLWKITKRDLDTFRIRVQNGLDVTSVTFQDIMEWPARGNVYGGDSVNEYAPFVDVNNNHLYEPLLGDYPMIKGDLCIYTIINDDITHTESGGQAMQLDIHRMAYAYFTNDVLNNTVFVDYKIVNRSNRNYDSLVFSSWVDFDLGYSSDDYVGTDSARNMIYAYNGDPNDQSLMGYGLTPPAQACVLLNQKMWTTMYYNNTDNPISGNVTAPSDYYAYMLGLWKDGTPKTAADTGYLTNGPVTRFSFNGDPCANSGWWEGSAALQPGDRRILASIAPQSFAPNQELEIHLAFVYARADSGDNVSSVCDLQHAVDTVINWYKNMPTTGIKPLVQPLSFSIYPNPAKNTITISGIDQKTVDVTIMDMMGRTLIATTARNNEVISIDDLNAGIYFVKIDADNGVATKRFIKE
jgi:hypothetical protein